MSMGCQLLDHLRHRSYDQDGVHVVELEVSDDILGPGGAVHGGIIASLVDRAGAYAIARDSQRVVATSNMALNYLALADVGPLRAVASSLRVGRQLGVVEVKVFDAGKDDRLVATALVTLSYLTGDLSSSPRGEAVGQG
jgi:uncharacterized protein (TIGR00369 family)